MPDPQEKKRWTIQAGDLRIAEKISDQTATDAIEVMPVSEYTEVLEKERAWAGKQIELLQTAIRTAEQMLPVPAVQEAKEWLERIAQRSTDG